MATLKERFHPAVVELEPYADPQLPLDHPEQPSFAPYSRLAICEEHGLQKVMCTRIINTGPGDTCEVGVMACDHIVAEDVF